jgi:hypothetical protein
MPMSMVLFSGEEDDTGAKGLATNPLARVAARRKAAVEEHVRRVPPALTSFACFLTAWWTPFLAILPSCACAC